MKSAKPAPKAPTLRVEKGRAVQVEFLPGRVAELPAFEAAGVGRFVVCKLAKQADGRYALVPQEWSQFVRVTRHLCRDLGLPCSRRQLERLARAGFLESSQVTPRGLWVSLSSIIEHFHATRIVEGELSWWTRERKETYYYANEAKAPEEKPVRRKAEAKEVPEKAKKPARPGESRQLDLFAA